MSFFSRQPVSHPSQRLMLDWTPGAWVGAVRRAFGAMPQPSAKAGAGADVIDHRPSHWLIALWRPQRLQQPFLFRWPYQVALHACEDQYEAMLQLLTQVPKGERLWVVSDDVDWGLLGEIVLLTEQGLTAFHYRALHEFIETERRLTLERIAQHYGVHEEAVTGFAETVPGAL